MNKKIFTPKRLAWLSIALIWAGAAVALFANSVNRSLLWVGLTISVVGLVLRLTAVRCPHCGARLADMQTVPDRCPNCGKKIN